MLELLVITHHMRSHGVTRHLTQVNTSRLTPARQADTWFTYPRGMEGWVDLGDRYGLLAHRWPATQVLTGQCMAGSQTRDLLITSLMPEPLHHQATLMATDAQNFKFVFSAVRIVVFHFELNRIKQWAYYLKFRIESNCFCRSQTDNLLPFSATIVIRNSDNFGDCSHPKWWLTIVAVLATVAAENGDYRRQRRRQFVAFLVTIFAVIVPKTALLRRINYLKISNGCIHFELNRIAK